MLTSKPISTIASTGWLSGLPNLTISLGSSYKGVGVLPSMLTRLTLQSNSLGISNLFICIINTENLHSLAAF